MTFWEYLWAGSWITKGLWHLNGNSNDSSGNGNNWTDTNVTYWLAYGKFWQGALFNGSSSKIDLPDWWTLNVTNATIIVWVKTTTKGRMIVSNYTQKSNIVMWFQFFMSSLWYVRLTSWRWTGVVDWTDFKSCDWNIDYSDWNRHLIVWTSNGSTLSVYWDWVLQNTVSRAYWISYNSYCRANIGCNEYEPWTIIDYRNGSIDEVIIENRAWTATEINKYYTYTKGRFWI